MRLSADSNSPYYHATAVRFAEVWRDRHLERDVVEADEAAGWVRRCVRAGGTYVVESGRLVVEEVSGHVEIRFPGLSRAAEGAIRG